MTGNSDLAMLSASDWDSSIQFAVDDMNGEPLNVHKLLANHPALLDAWWKFRNYIVRGGALSQRDAEVVILRTAIHSCCWYEWASHVDRGLRAGLSLELINSIAGGAGGDGQTEDDHVLLDAVDDLENYGAVQVETRELFVSRFSERQLLDVIAIRASYIMLAGILSTWNVPVDAHVLAALPESVTEDSFEDALGDYD